MRSQLAKAAALLCMLTLSACALFAPRPPAPIVLTGQITRADFQTYKEIPFTVPKGVGRITVTFDYQRDNRTVIDLGMRDPEGQRGWSGGNKSTFTISTYDATPSYRAGPIQPGEWKLVLGIPNIREDVTASYTATITFGAAGPPQTISTFASTPPAGEAGWRRGDFHTHTGHSDGSCVDNGPLAKDGRGPCPVIRTIAAAVNAKLDFVAVTDHNTLSQLPDLGDAARAYPDFLVIPGEEITTFQGHANAIGVTNWLDFQLGSPRLPTVASLLDQVEAQAALLSVNHPAQPSGEVCMGCGWTAETDFSRIAAIEAVNGGSVRAGKVEGEGSGVAYWEGLLDQGFHITAIGGSDNHDATDDQNKQSPIGIPATNVWTTGLARDAIVAGVRGGRVFIDLAGNPANRFETEARLESLPATVNMGETLQLPPGEQAILRVAASGVPNARIDVRTGGLDVLEPEITRSGVLLVRFAFNRGATQGWIRANVRTPDGKLVILGNPIYVQAPKSDAVASPTP